jgi:hypothetical protein
MLYFRDYGSRDKSVGIATRYGLNGEVRLPAGARGYLCSPTSRPALGPTQPPMSWVPRALSPGIKQPGRQDDHTASYNGGVENMWNYSSSPPHAKMA